MDERSHRYLPTGSQDLTEMLRRIGAESIEALFATIPAEIRLDAPPDLPGPEGDLELRRYFGRLEQANRVAGRDVASFLGGGAYRHEVPAAVDHLLHRAEFFTVYTPYQPEISQGTLQAIFEFQTLVSMLTGLPVANASLYDGASAFAEAILMADRLQRGRRKVVVSRGVHPQYREALATYVQNLELEVVEVGWDEDGATDRSALADQVDEETVCVAVQSPNYFGVVEGWRRAAEVAHAAGALVVGVVAEALSMALLESPGAGGCDIAVGEAQSFGLSLAYGGPYLGFLAAGDDAKRAMPGRLVGETVDVDEKRAFVLTLATREQHIRRAKATSNICTNQSLCALAATIYLALHGKSGLRRLAEINLQRAARLRRRLEAIDGVEARFASPSFNEFLLRTRKDPESLLSELGERGILGGLSIGGDYPELDDTLLVAVTETNPVDELSAYETALSDLVGGNR
ncbi:MAG: aminomethyl-transferring glycine dehydrogenase subunit GcvPA [Thermoanaerobaculia bacterium]|nr:aminomethyl-transferring glycine dehydrogenase subunit GcvPA [Thermoanaerobaculia bacterium]